MSDDESLATSTLRNPLPVAPFTLVLKRWRR
jgi:hypothetical protein